MEPYELNCYQGNSGGKKNSLLKSMWIPDGKLEKELRVPEDKREFHLAKINHILQKLHPFNRWAGPCAKPWGSSGLQNSVFWSAQSGGGDRRGKEHQAC